MNIQSFHKSKPKKAIQIQGRLNTSKESSSLLNCVSLRLVEVGLDQRHNMVKYHFKIHHLVSNLTIKMMLTSRRTRSMKAVTQTLEILKGIKAVNIHLEIKRQKREPKQHLLLHTYHFPMLEEPKKLIKSRSTLINKTEMKK